jgi:hypothetical protein
MLTPYAGIGKVNFGLVNLAAEVDRTGENQSVSAKLGFRF